MKVIVENRPTALFAVLLCGAVAFLGVLAADAGAVARVNRAVAVTPGNAGGPCARQARRATRKMSTHRRGSRRHKARRARAIRRRCLRRLRRIAKRGSLSQAPVYPTTGSLVIGVDGHYAGWDDEEVEDRNALDAAVTRHEWDLDNPPESEEQQVLAGATEIETRIHALLGGNDIGNASHYRDWVVAFVRYWGPGGSFWGAHPELDASRYAITSIELGNEPYFGAMSATEYAQAVRPALEAVAALNLPVKVILPSYIHGQNTSWIDTLYARIPNLNGLFYAFADHPYWYGHDPAEHGDNGPFDRIDTLRARMAEHGAADKPLYITEYGESTAACGTECVGEAEQAAHLQEMLNAIVTRADWGVEMFSVFQLRDRGTGSGDREQQFGLLREDGSQKPSYGILQAAMQQYRG